MSFQTMDPSLARQLIEHETNIITLEAQIENEVFKNTRCPVCGHIGANKVTIAPRIIPTPDGPQIIQSPFSSASSLVMGHAKCEVCQTEYSPTTGVIIRQQEPILTDPNFTDE
jgi:rubredoxin